MDIYMIWARDTKFGYTWMLDAWDSDTIDENYRGWQEAKAKHMETEKEENIEVRIVRTTVDYPSIEAAFDTPKVYSGPVEVVED